MGLLDKIFWGKNTVKVSVTAKEPYIGTPQPAVPAPVLMFPKNIGELNKKFNLSKLKLFEDSEYIYKLDAISKQVALAEILSLNNIIQKASTLTKLKNVTYFDSSINLANCEKGNSNIRNTFIKLEPLTKTGTVCKFPTMLRVGVNEIYYYPDGNIGKIRISSGHYTIYAKAKSGEPLTVTKIDELFLSTFERKTIYNINE